MSLINTHSATFNGPLLVPSPHHMERRNRQISQVDPMSKLQRQSSQRLLDVGPTYGLQSPTAIPLNISGTETLLDYVRGLVFPHSGDSLESLRSLNSLEPLEMDVSENTSFPKDPFLRRRASCDTRSDIITKLLRSCFSWVSHHYDTV